MLRGALDLPVEAVARHHARGFLAAKVDSLDQEGSSAAAWPSASSCSTYSARSSSAAADWALRASSGYSCAFARRHSACARKQSLSDMG
jgi:hypothetical protein